MKIVPDEIPEDTAPIDAGTLLEDAVNTKRELIVDGKNMFVTFLNGEFKVGRVEWVDADHITVGTSDPIAAVLVASAREV